MKGQCDVVSNMFGNVTVPCFAPSDPSYMDDQDALEVLKEICPELMTNGHDSPLLCCGASHISHMAASFEMPMHFGLAKCPSCAHNFRINFCQLSCSPNQADFIEVSNTTELPDGRHMVTALEYHVSERYANQLYESCANVQGPFPGQYLLSLMCGPWGHEDCNGSRWLEFMGQSVDNGGQMPMEINYHFHNASSFITNDHKTIKPMDMKTYKCSEKPSESSFACNCTDCIASCTSPGDYGK